MAASRVAVWWLVQSILQPIQEPEQEPEQEPKLEVELGPVQEVELVVGPSGAMGLAEEGLGLPFTEVIRRSLLAGVRVELATGFVRVSSVSSEGVVLEV